MGQSTDAILVYGIPLKEDSLICDFSGDESPDRASPEGMVYWGDAVDDVSIETHCSAEYPMYIVALAKTKKRAWRGSPRMIEPSHLTLEDSEKSVLDETLQDFVRRFELTADGEPGWYLCSYWG